MLREMGSPADASKVTTLIAAVSSDVFVTDYINGAFGPSHWHYLSNEVPKVMMHHKRISQFSPQKKDLITTPESWQIASTGRLIVHEATIEPNWQIRAAV